MLWNHPDGTASQASLHNSTLVTGILAKFTNAAHKSESCSLRSCLCLRGKAWALFHDWNERHTEFQVKYPWHWHVRLVYWVWHMLISSQCGRECYASVISPAHVALLGFAQVESCCTCQSSGLCVSSGSSVAGWSCLYNSFKTSPTLAVLPDRISSFICLWRFVYFHFMCMSVLTVHYVCVPCVRLKRASDPPDLELQTVVSHHLSAGNRVRSSARAVSALNHCILSPCLFISRQGLTFIAQPGLGLELTV